MDAYKIAIIVGGCLGAFWIVAYFINLFFTWVWSWVDDKEMPRSTLLVKLNAKVYGYRETRIREFFNGYGDDIKFYREKDKRRSQDGDNLWVITFFILCLTPFVIATAIKFYVISLFIITTVAVLYLARLARRQQKLFNNHVNDANAHKKK